MKYALISGNRFEAVKGFKGICPNCDGDVVAKCGEFRMDHWAHKSNRNCDPWWEAETEWHRRWKNFYPAECQEVSLHDIGTYEKHIADVRTRDGLVIEFQHSPIRPEERGSREAFYKNMIWVVDGTRLKYDYPRFKKGMPSFRNTDDPQVFHFDAQDECFPRAWLGGQMPVIFDFHGNQTTDDTEDPRNYLYCIQPNSKSRNPFLVKLTKQEFINLTISGEWNSAIKKWFNRPNNYDQLRHSRALQDALQNARNRQLNFGFRWREIIPAIFLFVIACLFIVKKLNVWRNRW